MPVVFSWGVLEFTYELVQVIACQTVKDRLKTTGMMQVMDEMNQMK